ncbi:hypothetical protein [Oscillatoria sp. FACHB-1406]|uniref:hypothetical protein n=1 Tax=Oscillatoria sp. FACHB-1406 TaxID=2692846 RepID=UPI001681F1F3|nr:hypothetical protein [Oscillatoria sp. FACHB-1406]MBD2580057.1 hypothetical protein [Oscillatoria sp. FACHB-1406]
MDELYREMVALERKVDRLYNLVVNLDRQMGELLIRESKHSEEGGNAMSVISSSTPVERAPLDPMMQHKDVLVDDSDWDMLDGETYKNVSPELQIRRLTAQVTAAYTRIAALEEQLLARRVSSHSQSH